MKLLRYLLFAAALAIGFSIWLAPAGLLRWVLGDVPNMDIVNTGGSLWHGRGTLVVQGEGLGTVDWKLVPVRLLSGELGFSYDFSGRDTRLHGTLGLGVGQLGLAAGGLIGSQSLNYTLAPYGITVAGGSAAEASGADGDVLVDQFTATWSAGRIHTLDGLMAWGGGSVSWNGGPQSGSARLPPLQARFEAIDGAVHGILAPTEGQIPLMQGNLQPDGLMTIGMTRLLTRLLGMPWSGSDPDHAIVMEMTEDVF